MIDQAQLEAAARRVEAETTGRGWDQSPRLRLVAVVQLRYPVNVHTCRRQGAGMDEPSSELVRLPRVVERWGHLPRGDDGGHEPIIVTGRIVSSYREAGGFAFVMLSDQTAELQVILTLSRLGAEQFEEAAAWPVAEHMVVQGYATRTRRGVLSVMAQSVARRALEAIVCCDHPLGRHKLTGRLYGWCYGCGRRCPEQYWVAGGPVDQAAPVTL